MAFSPLPRDKAGRIDFTASAPVLDSAKRTGANIEVPSDEDRAHAQNAAVLRQREIGEAAFLAAAKTPGTPESVMVHVWRADVLAKIGHPAAS